MVSKPEPIPESVQVLLRNTWKHPDSLGFSVFRSNFEGKENAERRRDPSYYHIRLAEPDEPGIASISGKEALDLHAERVYGALSTSQNTTVSVNEHAHHALLEFCEQVSKAWSDYRDRVAAVEAAGPIPQKGTD